MAEVKSLRADVAKKRADNQGVELDNVRQGNEILLEQIVKPLKTEIKNLRHDVNKFRRAVEKIPACPHSTECPVSRELDVYKRQAFFGGVYELHGLLGRAQLLGHPLDDLPGFRRRFVIGMLLGVYRERLPCVEAEHLRLEVTGVLVADSRHGIAVGAGIFAAQDLHDIAAAVPAVRREVSVPELVALSLIHIWRRPRLSRATAWRVLRTSATTTC